MTDLRYRLLRAAQHVDLAAQELGLCDPLAHVAIGLTAALRSRADRVALEDAERAALQAEIAEIRALAKERET
jgi:hypothetical protein